MHKAIASGIHTKENEEQQREAPKRTTAIAEEGQRNANYGGQPQHHADIDEEMKEEDAQYAVSIDAAKGVGLSLCQIDEPQNEEQKKKQDNGTPEEALLFAHGAEDEVGCLLRHILQFGLRAVQETLALQSAGAYGNLCLNDIVACAGRVVHHTEKHIDSSALMVLKDMIERDVGRIMQCQRADGEQGDEGIATMTVLPCQMKKVDNHADADTQLHPNDIERNDILGKEQGGKGQSHAIAEDCQDGVPTVGADHEHARGKQEDEQQNEKLSETDSLKPPQRVVNEAYAYYEIYDCRNACKQDGAGHAFAIEHQEEGQIDQGTSRLFLEDDGAQRQDDNESCHKRIAPTRHTEVVAPHILGEAQGSGKLGKLRRLQAEASIPYPRP